MRVVCIGECMVEFLRQDDGLWRQGFAGDSLNVAWALRALLPADAKVDYLTRVGTDALSEAMLEMLRTAGIGTGMITREPKRTVGLYTIQTDLDGERSFAYWRSDSAARGLAEDARHLAAALAGADLVYLSGITLAILPPPDRDRLMAALGERGTRPFLVAFDPNIRPRLWPDPAAAADAVTLMAGLAEILLPTHDDEAAAFGDADAGATLARYRTLGVPEVVVKDGKQPTRYDCDGEAGMISVTPALAVDTTGAGDSFNGAYLAARLRGTGVTDAVAQAQRVSAAVVGQRGAVVAADALRAAATGVVKGTWPETVEPLR
jgi:2-dehydro-3-deoxygluconokinase